MKILFIVPYPTEGPSNRFRVEQYLPYLKKENIRYSLRPFLNRYLYKILYKKGFFFRKAFFFIILTFRRFYDAIGSFSYDIVFIHREAFPFGSFMERLFRVFAQKVIYDFDDAIFLPNVSDSNRLIEFLKDTSKTGKIIKMSDCIIAGNNFLKDYSLVFNKNTFVLVTPIDTDKYAPILKERMAAGITIGWIGSTTTVKYLDILGGIFSALFKKYENIRLLIVGGGWNKLESPRVVCKQWSLDSEVSDLQSFDIGIMPLADDNWSRGKCAFKIIEYMAIGIPVVASVVGMNKEVIEDGLNGFLARTDDEWIEKISSLIENAEMRKRIGLAGRRTVEEKYSVKINSPKFLEIIKRVHCNELPEL